MCVMASEDRSKGKDARNDMWQEIARFLMRRAPVVRCAPTRIV